MNYNSTNAISEVTKVESNRNITTTFMHCNNNMYLAIKI